MPNQMADGSVVCSCTAERALPLDLVRGTPWDDAPGGEPGTMPPPVDEPMGPRGAPDHPMPPGEGQAQDPHRGTLPADKGQFGRDIETEDYAPLRPPARALATTLPPGPVLRLSSRTGDRMPDSKPQRPDDAHEKARDLGEKALEDLAQGREKDADRHIEQAKRLDEGALRELVQDLDEDAGANPDAVKDRCRRKAGGPAARPTRSAVPALLLRPGLALALFFPAVAAPLLLPALRMAFAPAPFLRAPAFVVAAAALVLVPAGRRRRLRRRGPGQGSSQGPPRRPGQAAGRGGWPRRCGSAARRRQRAARGPDAAADQRAGADIAAGQRADAGARPGAQQAARDGAAAGGLAAGGQGQQQQGGDCSPCHVFLRGSYRSGTQGDAGRSRRRWLQLTRQ